jgi:hypothetical protein
MGAVVVLLVTTGCIVAPPPESGEPQRTPPILDLYSAKPFPGSVISIDRQDNDTVNDRVEFKIPLRSDDQGEWLLWVLSVDRTFTGEKPAFRGDVPPSTLDDTNRYVEAPWSVDSSYSKGCHTLSIVIAHLSSWNRSNQVWPELLDASDAALGTWWVNLDPLASADPNTLVRCPNHGETEH